jgi:hypothetical protein
MSPYQKKHAFNDDDDDDDESTVANALPTGTSSRCKVRFSLESNQSFPIPHIDDMDDMDDEEVFPILYVQRRCKIRFSLDSNQSFPVPHVNDMDDEEYFAIWYEPSDYQMIKSEIFRLLRKIMKGEQIEENDKQTVRGIECRTVQAVNLRTQNKLKAMTAVLDEQDRQFDDGEPNDELLAEAYRNATYKCQDEAYALGLKDQAELQKELDTTKRELISSLQKSTDSKKSSAINGWLKQVGPSSRALPTVAHRVCGTAA